MQINTGPFSLKTGPQKKSKADLCVVFHAYIAARQPSKTMSEVPTTIDQKCRFGGGPCWSAFCVGGRGGPSIARTGCAACSSPELCDQGAGSLGESSITAM